MFEDREPQCTLLVFVHDATQRADAAQDGPDRKHLFVHGRDPCVYRAARQAGGVIPTSTVFSAASSTHARENKISAVRAVGEGAKGQAEEHTESYESKPHQRPDLCICQEEHGFDRSDR